jgi:hypothetical protein
MACEPSTDDTSDPAGDACDERLGEPADFELLDSDYIDWYNGIWSDPLRFTDAASIDAWYARLEEMGNTANQQLTRLPDCPDTGG